MINVTKPFLPPKEVFLDYVDEVWKRNWLTNNGPLVNELELKLKEFLGVNHILFLSNGTIALQIAIKALELKGEIVTTPFSYVATTSSIVWENCKPVFVDIDGETLNINPELIEGVINENTSAILATHVYGNPCNVEKIEKVAQKYKLKVIYDGAHAFGTKLNGKSIFEYGDITTTSFHSTKLFHTIEGGSVFTRDSDILKKMSYLRNFGHDGPESFAGIGINGKNCEFHAAMGLSNLRYINDILDSRKKQSLHYDESLKKLDIKKPIITLGTTYNYSYYPIIFNSESSLLKAKDLLERQRVYTRRYFYPSLNNLSYVDKFNVPIAEEISKRVLCLPLYFDLTQEEQDMISRILLRAQNY